MNTFQHLQAAHCENGVTTSMLRHYGLDFINEPLAFGIGSGLFYIHIPFMKVHHAPAISFRTMPGAIFNRTCKALNIPVVRKKFRNPNTARITLEKLLAEGKIVGCQVGVFHLPYFPKEYRFHFNAHNIIVYGKKDGKFLVSDPIMEYTTELSEKELEKVRFARGALAPKGYLYYPEKISKVNEEMVRRAIVKGIKRNVRDMIYIPGWFAGVKGIKYTSRKIRKWRNELGIKKAGLYLGQIVRMQEEIGTGGGGFRFVYGAFLEQASGIFGMDELKTLSDDMTRAGDLWRNSAMQMAGIYKGKLTEQADFDVVADILMEVSELEKNIFTRLGKLKFPLR